MAPTWEVNDAFLNNDDDAYSHKFPMRVESPPVMWMANLKHFHISSEV